MCPSGTGYNYFLACDTAERIIFAVVAGSGSGKLCRHSRGTDNDQENAGYVRENGQRRTGVAPAGAGWGVSCSGTSNFLFCKKKVTKENHSNLWFKDPWRGEGKCKFGGADLAELVRWVTLLSVQGSLVPLAPLPLTAVRVGVGALVEWRLSNRAFAALRRQR